MNGRVLDCINTLPKSRMIDRTVPKCLILLVLLEVENMNLVTAIQVLFAQNAPAGANFEEAFIALEGKKLAALSRTDVSTLDELADTFQDFVHNPAGWLDQASTADPRHSWWTKLAQALGVSVSAPGGSPPPTGSIEVPATRRKTPAARKMRLDAEAAERQRRRDEDARERRRRQTEEEESYRRRLAIEAEADEAKGLADLRLAAEKQRLDDEAEECRAEWRRARDEELERKLLVPPPFMWRLVHSAPYLRYYDRIRDAYIMIRDTDPNVSQVGRARLAEVLRLCREMINNREYLGRECGVHLLEMASALEKNQDLREPSWFQAFFISGEYNY